MLSLKDYAQHVYTFACAEVEAHLVRTVMAPLGLVTDSDDGSSVWENLLLYALPPWCTNVRDVTAQPQLTSVGEESSLPYTARTLGAVGLDYCVAVVPTAVSLLRTPNCLPWMLPADEAIALSSQATDTGVVVVVVDQGCAEAVLRGSDVFAPGIITASAFFERGQRVRLVWAVRRYHCPRTPQTIHGELTQLKRTQYEAEDEWLFRTALRRGVSLPDACYVPLTPAEIDHLRPPRTTHLTPSVHASPSAQAAAASAVLAEVEEEPPYLVHIGDGVATMHRRAVLRGDPGLAVQVSWTPRGQPRHPSLVALLRGPAASSPELFLQNYSSMVPVSLLVQRLLLPGSCPASSGAGGGAATTRHVLDACAAPGGKTSLLLSLLARDVATPEAVRVVCCERSRPRFDRLMCLIEEHLSVKAQWLKQVLHGCCVDVNQLASQTDADLGPSLVPERGFDAVLLDPPCTGLGLRPKLAPHQLSLALIRQSADYQRKLFDSCLRLMHPRQSPPRVDAEAVHRTRLGTRHIVYSTCTITLEENEANVLFFLEHYPQLRLARTTTAEEHALCHLCTTQYGSTRFLLEKEIEAVQARKDKALEWGAVTDVEHASQKAPLLVLRFMPRFQSGPRRAHGKEQEQKQEEEPEKVADSPLSPAEEDGVGFFVAVFEVCQ